MGQNFDGTRRVHIHLNLVQNGRATIHITHNHRRALLIQSQVHRRINRNGSTQLDFIVGNVGSQEERVHRVDVLKGHVVGSIILLAREDPLQVECRGSCRLVLAERVAVRALVQSKERLFIGSLVRQERLNVAVQRRQLALVEARHLYVRCTQLHSFQSHRGRSLINRTGVDP